MANSFEMTGYLVEVHPTDRRSEKFSMRRIVLDSGSTYNGNRVPNFVPMQLINERCALADRLKVGDRVRVDFNVKGNRVEKDGVVSYFANMQVWRITLAPAD